MGNRNFANENECNQLINEAENNGFKNSEVDSKTEALTSARTSTTSFLSIQNSPIGNLLSEKVKKIIPYQLEGIQVQKYDIGQKYNPHYDTFDDKDGEMQRNWTFMIYLSNVEEGGGTYFPNINLRIFPKKGKAVFWNNLNTDGCRNIYTLHTGEPIINGTKYIVTYWFHKRVGDLCPKKNSFSQNYENPTDIDEHFSNVTKPKNNFSIQILLLIGLIFILIILCVYLFL